MPSCQPRRYYNLSPLLFQSQVQILHPKSLQPRSKDLARTKSSRSSSRHCPCGLLPWSDRPHNKASEGIFGVCQVDSDPSIHPPLTSSYEARTILFVLWKYSMRECRCRTVVTSWGSSW